MWSSVLLHEGLGVPSMTPIELAGKQKTQRLATHVNSGGSRDVHHGETSPAPEFSHSSVRAGQGYHLLRLNPYNSTTQRAFVVLETPAFVDLTRLKQQRPLEVVNRMQYPASTESSTNAKPLSSIRQQETANCLLLTTELDFGRQLVVNSQSGSVY